MDPQMPIFNQLGEDLAPVILINVSPSTPRM
jgi:hypothetical protein